MKPSLLITALFALGFLLYTGKAYTETATEAFKNEQEVIRVNMVQLSRELGVTCTDCHSSKNWKDDSKATFKVAKDHMKTVEVLRAHGFNGKKGPEASCFMCHQGKMKFVHRMQHPENAAKKTDSKSE